MRRLVTRFAIASVMGLLAPFAGAQPHQPAYDAALADIAAKVAMRTGPGPRSCGTWFAKPGGERQLTPERVVASIACGRESAAAAVPFWFVVGGHGLDSWVAEGLLASENGAIEHYSYDSDPSGGSGVGARFDSRRCVGARVHRFPSGGLTIECLNEPWKVVVHAIVLGLSLVSIALGAVLARRLWVKTSVAAVTAGAFVVALGVGALYRLGAGRVDIAVPAVACCLIMVGFVVRTLRRAARLAA